MYMYITRKTEISEMANRNKEQNTEGKKLSCNSFTVKAL